MKISEMDKAVLLRLREYFRKDWTLDRRERGCLLSTKGEIIPFANFSTNPTHTIVMGPPGFMAMADLVVANTFDCWCHSHPVWPARPSTMDIDNHQTSVDMLIYSCVDDEFARYTVTEIIELEKQMKQATYSFFKKQGDTDGTNIRKPDRRSESSRDRSRRYRELVLSKAQ